MLNNIRSLQAVFVAKCKLPQMSRVIVSGANCRGSVVPDVAVFMPNFRHVSHVTVFVANCR